MIFEIRLKPVSKFSNFIEQTHLIKRRDVSYNKIIKGGNYLGIKIIILAIESTYFKFIIREINNQYFL